jgi:hypothetical protein
MTPSAADGQLSHQAGSVLLVCNAADVVAMVTEAIEQFALSLDVRRGTVAALDILARKKYEAVIVDLQLGNSADVFLRELHASPANHSAVTFTINTGTTAVQPGIHSGSMFTFCRPLTPTSINLTLKTAYGLILRERRRYFRCPVTMDAVLRTEDGQEVECQTVDVAEGGMSLRTTPDVKPSVRFTVHFTLPGQSLRLAVESAVRWHDEAGRIGLQFLALSPPQKTQLCAWLSGRFEDSLPEHVAVQFRHADRP